MSVHEEEARITALLAPLARIEPVPLPQRRRPWSRRPVLVLAALISALLLAGVAIAAAVGAFDGISAAQRPQERKDIPDPQTAALLERARLGPTSPRALLETARLVGTLPSGREIYVVTNTRNDLCLVVERQAFTCSPPLTDSQPITIATMDNDGPGGQPPIAFGAARDGVVAVTFMAHGSEVTAHVKNNVWTYEGESSVLQSATVHYANGETTTLSH